MAALEYLDELRAARWWTAPSALIERIVHDRHVMTLAFAAPRARDVWRRIRFLVDQARLFEASQSADLVEFVAWAELQRSDMARVHEPLLPESDDHAVRIMTMHGAKGLEFPITVLSGLTTEIGRRRRRGPGALGRTTASTCRCARTSRPTASTGAPTSRRRWTATRSSGCSTSPAHAARDHLLVAAHHNVGGEEGHVRPAAVERRAPTSTPALWEHVERPGPTGGRRWPAAPAARGAAGASPRSRAAEDAWRRAAATRAARPRRGRTRSAPPR